MVYSCLRRAFFICLFFALLKHSFAFSVKRKQLLALGIGDKAGFWVLSCVRFERVATIVIRMEQKSVLWCTNPFKHCFELEGALLEQNTATQIMILRSSFAQDELLAVATRLSHPRSMPTYEKYGSGSCVSTRALSIAAFSSSFTRAFLIPIRTPVHWRKVRDFRSAMNKSRFNLKIPPLEAN